MVGWRRVIDFGGSNSPFGAIVISTAQAMISDATTQGLFASCCRAPSHESLNMIVDLGPLAQPAVVPG